VHDMQHGLGMYGCCERRNEIGLVNNNAVALRSKQSEMVCLETSCLQSTRPPTIYTGGYFETG
jgi:hypothetical protein